MMQFLRRGGLLLVVLAAPVAAQQVVPTPGAGAVQTDTRSEDSNPINAKILSAERNRQLQLELEYQKLQAELAKARADRAKATAEQTKYESGTPTGDLPVDGLAPGANKVGQPAGSLLPTVPTQVRYILQESGRLKAVIVGPLGEMVAFVGDKLADGSTVTEIDSRGVVVRDGKATRRLPFGTR